MQTNIQKHRFSFLLCAGILILSAWVSGCGGDRVLSASEYIPWYGKHVESFTVEKSVEDLEFRLTYIPTEVQVLSRLRGEGGDEAIRAALAEETGIEYYRLQIQSKDPKRKVLDMQHPYADVDPKLYFSFDLQQNLLLKTDSLEIPCMLYHPDQGLGMSEGIDCLLAFDTKVQPMTHRRLQIKDDFFGLGEFQISIQDHTIEQKAQLHI